MLVLASTMTRQCQYKCESHRQDQTLSPECKAALCRFKKCVLTVFSWRFSYTEIAIKSSIVIQWKTVQCKSLWSLYTDCFDVLYKVIVFMSLTLCLSYHFVTFLVISVYFDEWPVVVLIGEYGLNVATSSFKLWSCSNIWFLVDNAELYILINKRYFLENKSSSSTLWVRFILWELEVLRAQCCTVSNCLQLGLLSEDKNFKHTGIVSLAVLCPLWLTLTCVNYQYFHIYIAMVMKVFVVINACKDNECELMEANYIFTSGFLAITRSLLLDNMYEFLRRHVIFVLAAVNILLFSTYNVYLLVGWV